MAYRYKRTVQKADLTQREVEPPTDRWCEGAKGGHNVPDDAEFQGKPTRFFRLSGPVMDKSVVICEPCLVLANFMATRHRKLNKLKEELGID